MWAAPIMLKVLFIEKLNRVQHLCDVQRRGFFVLSVPLDMTSRFYTASFLSDILQPETVKKHCQYTNLKIFSLKICTNLKIFCRKYAVISKSVRSILPKTVSVPLIDLMFPLIKDMTEQKRIIICQIFEIFLDLAIYVDYLYYFCKAKFACYDNRTERRAENIAFGSTVGVFGIDSSLWSQARRQDISYS